MIKNCIIAIASLVAVSLPAAAQKITWKSVYTPDYSEITDATYGMSKYVAVGKDGAVLYSSNGQNWSKGKLPEGVSCDLNTVEFAFEQFWAGGKNLDTNKGVILLSLDGKNWVDVTNDYFNMDEDYSAPQNILQFLNYQSASNGILFMSYVRDNFKEIVYTREGANFYEGNSNSGTSFYQAGNQIGWLGTYRWEFATQLSGNIGYKGLAQLRSQEYG